MVAFIDACYSLWPYGLSPARLCCRWNFLGKNTGVGCHFLLQLICNNLLQNTLTYTLWCMCVCCCSVVKSCPTLCDSMWLHSTPGLPIPHYLLELAQVHVHWISDAFQPSHPLLSSSPFAFNLSQHQALFQWVNSSHQVARVLELQYQSL